MSLFLGENRDKVPTVHHPMLCHLPHHQHHFLHGSHLLRHDPSSTPHPLSILPVAPLAAHRSIHSPPTPPDESADTHRLTRRQNTLILHPHANPNKPISDDPPPELLLRRRAIEEASLATRRIPRFPGSVDFPDTERLDPSPPADPLSVLGGDDPRALQRALALRRGVAAEALKEALRRNKLSINYSNNLVACLPAFVDRIVIGAAEMKGDAEASHLSFNSRARSYIQSSGVVALVKWLKHNHLTFHQIGKVISMCSGDLDEVRRICEWLKSIHVKPESLGAVLVKAGPVWEHGLDVLAEIVDYMERNGVRREWVGFVVSRCPQLLSLSVEEVELRGKFYLDMGMNERDFGTMVYDYPKALGFFSMEEMNSKVKYLKEFGLNTADVGRLLAFKPQLMGCSIEERWKPLVKYLYYLGVRRDGMKRILMVKPMVFCVDLETTISPKVRFLQDIGIRQEAIGGVLVKFPHLLTYSLYKKIRPVVIFLMTKAGVTKGDIGKVIALDPQLVGCSIINKLDVNVKYFLSLGIHVNVLGEMIADFPMLLRYNLDILRPKYQYLRRTMVRPLKDLIEFPRFFSYSLEDRIIPRYKIMVANRVNFKLRYMLASSDEEFDQRVQAAVQKRERFECGGETDISFSDSESSNVIRLIQET